MRLTNCHHRTLHTKDEPRRGLGSCMQNLHHAVICACVQTHSTCMNNVCGVYALFFNTMVPHRVFFFLFGCCCFLFFFFKITYNIAYRLIQAIAEREKNGVIATRREKAQPATNNTFK